MWNNLIWIFSKWKFIKKKLLNIFQDFFLKNLKFSSLGIWQFKTFIYFIRKSSIAFICGPMTSIVFKYLFSLWDFLAGVCHNRHVYIEFLFLLLCFIVDCFSHVMTYGVQILYNIICSYESPQDHLGGKSI